MPKIILHNMVSLDGAITGFHADMETYYGIVNSYHPDMYLVGSVTAHEGISLFTETIPAETAEDCHVPDYDPVDSRPFWVIPDSTGRLSGLLHIFRRSGFCRDIIVLVSHHTPAAYIDYLSERHYEYIKTGDQKVDLKNAFFRLNELHPFEVMVTDSGGMLGSILLESCMADQVSLLLVPFLTGIDAPKLFRTLHVRNKVIELHPAKAEILDGGTVLLIYDVIR